MDNCIFCKIIAGQVSAAIVYRDDLVIAFMSLQQFNEGHTLVVPVRHFKDIYELPDELIGPLFKTAARIARGIKHEFRPDGIWLSQHNEPAAGQSVFHIHLHVIPRYFNDSLLKGIKLPPPSDAATLEALAARVRNGLQLV